MQQIPLIIGFSGKVWFSIRPFYILNDVKVNPFVIDW